jgi:hypothetical protein
MQRSLVVGQLVTMLQVETITKVAARWLERTHLTRRADPPGGRRRSRQAASPDNVDPSTLKSKASLIADVAVGLVAAAGAGVSTIVGLTNLPWFALVLLSVVLGALGFTIAQAIGCRDDATVSRMWWCVSTLTISLLVAGAYIYHVALDPVKDAQQAYELVVNGNPAQYIPLYGEAGGPREPIATGSNGQHGLTGGHTYLFECRVKTRDGAVWLRYRRYGQIWWAPRSLLHPPVGESQPAVRPC